ncbi:MAG: CHAT domain-containing protein, partial [Phormidesmis sp.]
MDKRVTLKLSTGTLETGFSASLQIGDEGTVPEVEISGSLPPNPTLKFLYQQWQAAYRRLGSPTRLEADTNFITNVSIVGDCLGLAEELKQALNRWLRADTFRPIQEKLLEKLAPDDTIRLILQAPTGLIQRLPWHLWNISNRYAKLEIALSAPAYEKATAPTVTPRKRVRILAIIGQSQGLDVQADQALLNRLPNAEVHFLPTPSRQTLNATLWDPQGWDILFFAGHSATRPYPSGTPVADHKPVGQIFINDTDALTVEQLKHALSKALTRGLKIAIFNSCDGLGLAEALADLQISQILVMCEPVSDPVAHAFLRSFLEAFASGEPMTLAVREAREQLQGLEGEYPCASWLPTLFQNPAELPPTWQTLYQTPPSPSIDASTPPLLLGQARSSDRLSRILPVHILMIVVILVLRSLGLLQGWELKAFDQFLRLRAAEAPDSRIVVVAVTEADVRAQDPEDRRGSLSDSALIALLDRLNTMEPHS